MTKICVKTLTGVTFDLDMQKESSHPAHRSVELSVDDVIEALPFPSAGCTLVLRGDVVSNIILLDQLNLTEKDFFVVIFDWKKFNATISASSVNRTTVDRLREQRRRQEMIMTHMFQRPANRGSGLQSTSTSVTSNLSPNQLTSILSSSGDEEPSAKRARRTQQLGRAAFMRHSIVLSPPVAPTLPTDRASEAALSRSDVRSVLQFVSRRRAAVEPTESAESSIDDEEMASDIHSAWHSLPFIERVLGSHSSSLSENVRAERVASVVNMGFSESASQRALQRAGYDVEVACELLLQGLEDD